MILIYPRFFEKNAPTFENVETLLFAPDLQIPSSGMYDTMVMEVRHKEDEKDLNYSVVFDSKKNSHKVTTFVDCRYDSKNLELLVETFKKIEDIWNGY